MSKKQTEGGTLREIARLFGVFAQIGSVMFGGG